MPHSLAFQESRKDHLNLRADKMRELRETTASGSSQMLVLAPTATQKSHQKADKSPKQGSLKRSGWEFDESCRAPYFTSSYAGLAVTLENDTRHCSGLFPSVIFFLPT